MIRFTKAVATASLTLVLGSPAAAAPPAKLVADPILTCDLFNRQVKAPVEHIIELHRDTASVDSVNYALTKSATTYDLYGPIGDRAPIGADLVGGTKTHITINRVNGSMFTFQTGVTDASEWTRPEDKGCQKATTKF
jgi:hypothetical protein